MAVWDLRSDFLSAPTPEAVAALAEAAAQPQGFGLREHPVQQALEQQLAALLGHEDALLFPTCTMANLVAIMAQVRPGELVLAEATSHCLLSEAGGIAAVAGVMSRGIEGQAGEMDLAALERAISAPGDAQQPPSGMVLLETTHNRAGGVPLSLEHLTAVSDLCRRYDKALHIDGARLWSAAVALDLPPARIGGLADSVSVSLNKGFGAPALAMLAGSSALIERALVLRQRLGGGMRPIGALAAAALALLPGWEARLRADHAKAEDLAQALASGGLEIVPAKTRTNMLLLRTAPGKGAAVLARLKSRGVLALPFAAPDQLRLCLHSGIAARDIPALAAAVLAACDSAAAPDASPTPLEAREPQ